MSQINDVNKQYDFELDLDKGYIGEESISLIQSSSNVREFKIALTKENKPFNLNGCLVKVVCFKPSDNSFVGDVTDINGNIVTVSLDEQCMAEDGRVRCEIVVIDLINPRFITFPLFRFKVKGSLFVNSGIESSTEFQTLINMIVKVDSINDVADEKFSQIDGQLDSAKLVIEELKVTQEVGLDLLANIESSFVESQQTVGNILNNYDVSESLLDEVKINHSGIATLTTQATNNAKAVSDKKDQAISNVNLITTNKTESDTLLKNIQSNKSTTDTLLGRVQSNDAEATKSLNSIKSSETSVNKIQQVINQTYDSVQSVGESVSTIGSEIVGHGEVIKQQAINIEAIYSESETQLETVKTEITRVQEVFNDNENIREKTFIEAEVVRQQNEIDRETERAGWQSSIKELQSVVIGLQSQIDELKQLNIALLESN